MKKILFAAIALCSLSVNAQEADEVKPAAKGVVYGITPAETAVVSVNELQAKMVDGFFEGQVTGKVTEVCQTMGCWMKIQKADGTTLMVKTKDHKFFMPKDIVGKTVVVDGVAKIKEETEAKRKHYAEDAGKSKEEIAKIKGSQKEVQFIAAGVKVIE